ncbi:MAG: ABC transporter substrate-binding protein [Ornithinimicrobium sp.]|uniref:ABC transporter substrate-binding protein n=1 Tax=Ornithinimicrobium sp. TaxID=1977084 RepID=UPI0026DF3C97|nr:ABC transporter substrate-binding protein [Ornithinimicrobium sp.]MDO5740302.1 ABC transporter substrate-binding protein [Ornithinimicrobium sp.]
MNPHLPRALVTTVTVATVSAFALAGCSTGDPDPTSNPPANSSASSDAPATESDTASGTSDAAGTTDSAATASFPVTIDAANGEVVIEAKPERIVSLSPSATEILFAIGAGDQVVAADDFSTYPAEAPTTDLSGYDPNVEAIVAYQPDLVVVANDSNDLVASLDALDIPVIVSAAPADVEGGYHAVAGLGQATGHIEETADVVATMRAEMTKAFNDAPQDEQLRIYHELDETFFSASSNSFIGSVYDRMGAVNIADEADVDKTGYPQLTEEAIIEADPQLIIITDQASYTAQDLAKRPGWSKVSAVKEGNIVVVNADIASRWGPRLPQLVTLVADAMSNVKVPAGR